MALEKSEFPTRAFFKTAIPFFSTERLGLFQDYFPTKQINA